MSISEGSFVVQYLNSRHRYGVVSGLDHVDESYGWSYFNVRWAEGGSTVERVDKLKLVDIVKTVDNLMRLKEL